MIPNHIIQFWHDFTCMPDVIRAAMSCSCKHNSDFVIIQADDEFMHNFILKKYNKPLLKLYQMNRIPSSRSDIARLMLLYEYGGYYVDASMELHGSLSRFSDDDSDVVLVRRDDIPLYKAHPEKAHVINGMIAAPAKSPFIKWCLQRAIRYLASGEQNKRVNMATGPVVINQALEKYDRIYKIKKLSLKQLRADFLVRKTVPGVSNAWALLQRDGILDPDLYDQNLRSYEKFLAIKNRVFYLSFGFLSLK